ncbi:MAG: sulfatase [Halioglobus sp.]
MKLPVRLLSAFAALLVCPLAQSAERPNIVFIMSDDHAVRAVSAYDDSLMQTPNIDRIAAGGMRFDRAYVGNAICGPSRATMLTGNHSHANGFYSNEWSGPFDGTQQTLPTLLQDAGYRTAVVGKWHLYSDPVGFDHWEVINNAFEQGTYYNPEFRSPAGVEQVNGYVAELVTDKALNWLNSVADGEQPFFLLYNHKTPHRDWLPGPQELRAWDEAERVQEPPTLLRDLGSATRARQDARMRIADYMTDGDVKLSMARNLTPQQTKIWEQAFAEGNRQYEQADLNAEDTIRWKYQRYIKTYIASVRSMDREIGRLLDYLEARGLMDNTLVVYTSDQGFFLGENGWFDKRWMDEVSSRVPLLLRWPARVEAGGVNRALVQNIDFAPTLLDAAGIQPPEPMHGISLMPLLTGEVTDWNRQLYYHFYENPGFHGVPRHYGIHTGRYKLVHYYRYDEWELFDIESDPGEQVNLYDSDSHQQLVRRLKDDLANLRNHYAVPEEDPEVPWYHGPLIRFFEWLLKLL